jgi:hypothetical protein
VKLLDTLTTTARKAGAVIDMRRLDTAPRRHPLTPAESLHSTLQWLMRAQDGTPDDGVSYGFSLNTGWSVSYPETTGYILQTFLKYHDIFRDADVLKRAHRMAQWEVDIQLSNGATPGSFGTPRVVPVAFNTGQVLLGWAEYLRRFPEDARVRNAAIKAGRWLISCMGDKPWFEAGVSAKAEHGNLSYNSMVSWGLAELGEAVGDPAFTHAAHVSATHYASQVDERRWLYKAGFSDADCTFPLTHTLGYSIQGFIETGRLTGDEKLVETGREILEASCRVIDAETGFLPGRVQSGWQGGAKWACLTGSAQFACCFLQLQQMGRGCPQYVSLAEKLVANVVATQFSQEDARLEIAGGVRGSFPFSTTGYEPIALPNWAAKFLVDAELMLHVQGRL